MAWKAKLQWSANRCHDETYNPAAIAQSVAAYDQQLLSHWQASGRQDGEAWSTNVSSYYARNYRPQLKQDMLSTGIDPQ